MDLSQVTHISIPAYYTCTGNEQGICEATFDGITYQIYINSATSGAKIIYLNGHFYAVNGGVDITQPEAQTSKTDPLPVPDAPEQITLRDPDTGTTTTAVFDTPDVEVELGQSIEYNMSETDGVVTVVYRKSGTSEWTEIPVLTSDDVTRINNILGIVSVNIVQSGTTVHLT